MGYNDLKIKRSNASGNISRLPRGSWNSNKVYDFNSAWNRGKPMQVDHQEQIWRWDHLLADNEKWRKWSVHLFMILAETVVHWIRRKWTFLKSKYEILPLASDLCNTALARPPAALRNQPATWADQADWFSYGVGLFSWFYSTITLQD